MYPSVNVPVTQSPVVRKKVIQMHIKLSEITLDKDIVIDNSVKTAFNIPYLLSILASSQYTKVWPLEIRRGSLEQHLLPPPNNARDNMVHVTSLCVTRLAGEKIQIRN